MKVPESFKITYIGTATVLLEIGGLRILTDPVFDQSGQNYAFGWGTGSTKTKDPAVLPDTLGNIDLVLLSHDQHQDNLDDTGRSVLKKASKIVTTVSAAKRLGGGAHGLRKWQSIVIETPQGFPIQFTATPARHGPPLSRLFVGEVAGFILEWPGQRNGALYISGDTVWFKGIRQIGRRFKIGTALLHLGGVQFPFLGPLRFTFNGKEAVRTVQELNVKTTIPLHFEGWEHFRESRVKSEQSLSQLDSSHKVMWLELGVETPIEI